MKQYFKNSCFAILLFATMPIINSCELVVPLKLPKIPQKLVLNCQLGKNSVWQIRFSNSVPSLGKLQPQSLRDINITLKKGNTILQNMDWQIDTDTLRIRNQNGTTTYLYAYAYSSFQNLPEAGETYTIEASKEGYPAVTATETVPPEVEIKNATIIDSATYNFQKYYIFDIEFQDPQNQDNYYSLIVFNNGGFFSNDLSLKENDQQDPFGGTQGSPFGVEFYDNCYFTDALFKNQTKKIRIAVPIYSQQITEISAVLVTHSKANYFYEQTSQQQQQSSDEDPFSQPTIIYNNITNGLGIFASSNKDFGILKIR